MNRAAPTYEKWINQTNNDQLNCAVINDEKRWELTDCVTSRPVLCSNGNDCGLLARIYEFSLALFDRIFHIISHEKNGHEKKLTIMVDLVAVIELTLFCFCVDQFYTLT